MKLVDLTCTGCGANVKVDPSLQTVTCTVCGKQMMIARTGEYGEGYAREMGRIQAQRDTEEVWKREREEKIRQKEEAERLQKEKQEMNRIHKQLNIIVLLESLICIAFMLSPLILDVSFSNGCLRVVAGFVQLALVAMMTLFYTKDKYFAPIVIACVVCAIASSVSMCFVLSLVWFLAFNLLKLIWMMRIEHVRYSWKEILGNLKPQKKQNVD
ncbi:MAG: hypothetical protein KBT07_07270 [Clostridiales bacterium]|nr:hypothetical protein [Candidatus Scatonaster coprocaballi]